MKTSEFTGIRKISYNDRFETFEYRDMYNDVQTVTFPTSWKMTEEDVEEYLIQTK